MNVGISRKRFYKYAFANFTVNVKMSKNAEYLIVDNSPFV